MKRKLWKQVVTGVLAGVLVLQMTGAPANALLIETLTEVDGRFVRANGSVIEGALAKGIVNDYPNRTLWQYTDSGLVDGISGEVCIDIAFTDYSQILLATGWRAIAGKWYYYQDYDKQTGWIAQGDAWYYLNQDGSMAAGVTQVIDGRSYTFGSDGRWQP